MSFCGTLPGLFRLDFKTFVDEKRHALFLKINMHRPGFTLLCAIPALRCFTEDRRGYPFQIPVFRSHINWDRCGRGRVGNKIQQRRRFVQIPLLPYFPLAFRRMPAGEAAIRQRDIIRYIHNRPVRIDAGKIVHILAAGRADFLLRGQYVEIIMRARNNSGLFLNGGCLLQATVNCG